MALESIVAVVTGAPVGARMRQAVVDVILAEVTGETRQTAALEVVDAVNAAGSVQTRVLEAVVEIVLAAVARVTGWTDATVTPVLVNATSTYTSNNRQPEYQSRKCITIQCDSIIIINGIQ